MSHAIASEQLRSGFKPLIILASLAVASVGLSGCSDGTTMDSKIVTPPGGKAPDETPPKPNVTPTKGATKAEPI